MLYVTICTVRYPELVNTANKNYGGVMAMATRWGKKVRGRANQAKATQVRHFKLVWLAKSSPYAIVTNVLANDLDVNEGPMIVNPDLVKTGLNTVEDVRACLRSNMMYLNPVLYNLLCCGVESGKLKGGTKLKQRSSLRELMTVAHEAHLRLELYLALTRQRFNKNSKKDLSIDRKVLWEAFCELVFNDRELNAEAAEEARLRGVGVLVGGANVDEGADEEVSKPLVDKKYF